MEPGKYYIVLLVLLVTHFLNGILSALYSFKSMRWNHESITFCDNSLLIATGVTAVHSSLNLLNMDISFWNRTWKAQAANCQQPSGFSELVLMLKNHTHYYIFFSAP